MTPREIEDARIDGLIMITLQADRDLDPDFVSTTALTPREKAAVVGIDIDVLKAKFRRLRTAYTTAPVEYDGFGTVTYGCSVGVDHCGLNVRLVGIEPDHWDWQTARYASGMHAVATPEEARRFPQVWHLKP